MVNKYYSDIQHTKSIVNKINFQGFDYIISYLIKLFLKNIIFRTGKSINHAFINPIIMKNKNTKKDTNKIQYNPKRKILSNTNDKNAIIRNYVSISLIIFILITLLSQIKSNNIIYDSFHLQYSYNITLKIKGIGESNIFCNEEEYNFTGIDYLEEIYINNIQENPKKYSYYFNQAENFVQLIWNDNLNDFSYMFRKCSNITEINLSNFDTSKITSMNRMFTSCESLTLLDLSNIDTSRVENMENMFYGCSSLTSLDLSKFNTSKVVDMDSMFRDCSSLTSLNLSNFDTSHVTNMIYMFYNCSSLTSLDLSNFNTSLVESMYMMFYDCVNLEYINIYNFKEKELVNTIDIFANVPNNIVICINESSNTGSIISALIGNIKCHVIDCSNNWKSIQKKLINNNSNECIYSCANSTQYIYEYNGKCYENCSNGFLYDNSNGNKLNECKCELEKCKLCPNVALNKGLCTECNTNYYQKENDLLNLGDYINCYKIQEGYYLDNNLLKKCYLTCKTCNISGDNITHNCIECNDNYPIIIKENNYNNCYENCSYYYIDKDNKYHCTQNCPEEYTKLSEDSNECIKNDIKNIIKNLIKEKNETDIISKEQEITYYDNIIQTIEKFYTGNYDTSRSRRR